MRLLVVDNYAPFAASLALLLSPRHEVLCCTSAERALSLLRADARIELVFCDLLMPGLSGLDLHRLLKAEMPGRERNLIFMTGGALSSEAEEFLSQVRWLQKPFAPEALEGLLDERR